MGVMVHLSGSAISTQQLVGAKRSVAIERAPKPLPPHRPPTPPLPNYSASPYLSWAECCLTSCLLLQVFPVLSLFAGWATEGGEPVTNGSQCEGGRALLYLERTHQKQQLPPHTCLSESVSTVTGKGGNGFLNRAGQGL